MLDMTDSVCFSIDNDARLKEQTFNFQEHQHLPQLHPDPLAM
jgi:hypothetical protein